jgi:predicted naringenin-chalcone synthase
VLVVNIELCTLHLQDCSELEQALLFLLFSDGCAASIVSAEPEGIALDDFHSTFIPNTSDLMTWSVRDFGFDIVLSGQIPAVLQSALQSNHDEVLGGRAPAEVDLWAVHSGGRTVLDAVERAFHLPTTALSLSRETLRRYGNMSSPTVMFVLRQMLQQARSGVGCAMAFGPGLVAESMMFRMAA